jgi:hypothetical protein
MKQRLPIVLSTTALIVALLGATPAGEAAVELVIPKGSVGTPQLKNLAVTTPKLRNGAVGTVKLKNGAVTSLKVLNGSLLAADFKAGQLPAGAKGDKGDPGPPGLSEVELVTSASASTSISKGAEASCPAGKKVVGGGGATNLSPVGLRASGPTAGLTAWTVWAQEFVATAQNWIVTAWAICAKVG